MSQSLTSRLRYHIHDAQRQLAAYEAKGKKPRRGVLDAHWATFYSSFDDYMNEFKELIPQESIMYYLAAQQKPVVMDFLSPTYAVRSLLKRLPQQTKRGIAIGYEDTRIEEDKIADKSLGIDMLPLDMNKPDSFRKIDDLLHPDHAHLIMSRSDAGMYHIPVNNWYYRITLARMWRMLHPEGGMILLETPSFDYLQTHFNVPVDGWMNNLNRKGIEHKAIVSPLQNYLKKGLLFLRKHPDSPGELPYLD